MESKTKLQNQVIQQDTSKELSAQEEFENAIISTLDLDTWTSGVDLLKEYERINREVYEAVEAEERITKIIRKTVFPKISKGKRAIESSGYHRFKVEQIERAHRGLLFNGGVEACDGISVAHDTLPLTITQIGVCLTSYQGEQGSYSHRLYRRDFKLRGEDPVKEALELLDQRSKREAFNASEKDQTSSLAKRGVMGYAERAILLEKSKAKWRMGHGNPTPYELLTGFWATNPEMTETALNMMRKLVLEHKKFVFIPSAPKQRQLLTFGNALRPLEYLILVTIENELLQLIENGGARSPMRDWQIEFAKEVGPNIVIGLYRASKYSPPYMFYAHKDYAQTAALIAMADSCLQEHRGFPMLIDIADNLCKTTFGVDGFLSSVQEAYVDAGRPFQYLTERETR